MTVHDPRALRNAFGCFMTGVTVVTTLDAAGAPRGFTANSFTSVSLDPPLLLVCLAKQSRSLATFTEAQGFAVNVLAEDQREISMTFARPGEDRFSGIGWHLGPQGSPVLDGVSAWFDCARHEVVDAGDHVILVGRVAGFETHERGGLGYARGAYFTQGLADRAVTAAHAARVMVGAIIEGDGGVLLVRDGAGWGIPRAEMGQPRGPVTALDRLVGGSTSFTVASAATRRPRPAGSSRSARRTRRPSPIRRSARCWHAMPTSGASASSESISATPSGERCAGWRARSRP